MSAVEVTTSYVTTVPELTDAFAFVMERLDSVGPNPEVRISPIFIIGMDSSDDEPIPREFEVTVRGMTKENGSGA